MTPTEQDKELDKILPTLQVETRAAKTMLEQFEACDKARQAIEKLITADRKCVELEARVEENRRWLTVLAPSMDENVAYNSDFHHRIAELKAQQEK